MSKRVFAVNLFALLTLFSGITPAFAQRENVAPVSHSRHYSNVAWDTVMLVGGTVDDTVIQDPIRIAATRDALFVFDHGRDALMKLDMRGALVWVRGRSGAGPSEYRKVRDIAIGRNSLFLMDAENARIAKVDIKTGMTTGYISVQKLGYGEWVRQLDQNTLLVITAGEGAGANIVDTLGVVKAWFPLALPGYAALDGIASQVVVGVTQHPVTQWVTGYLMGNWWVSYNGSAPRFKSSFVEDVPDPVITNSAQGSRQITTASSAAFSVRGMYDDGKHVIMLNAGTSSLRGRILDYYDSKTGKYVESRLLPVTLSRFAMRGNQICGVTQIDDIPAVICLTPRTHR